METEQATFKINKRPRDDTSDDDEEIEIQLQSYPTFSEDLTREHKLCLVEGYSREQYQKDIPTEISNLFYDYYEQSSYWSINEESLSRMKQAKNCEEFFSNTFTYNNTNIQWYIQSCPNGWGDEQIGLFRYWIFFDPWPTNIISISAMCKMALYADDVRMEITKRARTFKSDQNGFGNSLHFPLSEIQSMSCKSLTIEAFMEFISIEFYGPDKFDVINTEALPESIKDMIDLNGKQIQ